MLTKSKSECDDNNFEIALVDANHELKISKVEIFRLRAQKDTLEKKRKKRITNKNLQLRN